VKGLNQLQKFPGRTGCRGGKNRKAKEERIGVGRVSNKIRRAASERQSDSKIFTEERSIGGGDGGVSREGFRKRD